MWHVSHSDLSNKLFTGLQLKPVFRIKSKLRTSASKTVYGLVPTHSLSSPQTILPLISYVCDPGFLHLHTVRSFDLLFLGLFSALPKTSSLFLHSGLSSNATSERTFLPFTPHRSPCHNILFHFPESKLITVGNYTVHLSGSSL